MTPTGSDGYINIISFNNLDYLNLQSWILYSDANPTSLTGVDVGPPYAEIEHHYEDSKPTIFTEMAAALVTLLWASR
jgi:hypothetical protein